jgi:hypothetical protein
MEFIFAAASIVIGVFLAKKALTSKNENVIALAGMSALVLICAAVLLLALYIVSN